MNKMWEERPVSPCPSNNGEHILEIDHCKKCPNSYLCSNCGKAFWKCNICSYMVRTPLMFPCRCLGYNEKIQFNCTSCGNKVY